MLLSGPLGVFLFVLLSILFAVSFVLRKRRQLRLQQGRSPFARDVRRETEDYVADHAKRDSVLKQGFTASKVPDNLDVIVIGSGIGGLTAGLLLARAGRKVLVLEQHDQAGGCCHTFYEKGFEFDTGIHYIGEMRNRTLPRFLIEQLTAGQLVWADMDDAFDIVLLGDGGPESLERFPICAGRQRFVDSLVEKFPDERAAIEKYVDMVSSLRRAIPGAVQLKVAHEFMAWILQRFGLVDKFTPFFKMSQRTLKEVLDDITDNQKLKAVLAYCWGDYGSPPCEASFAMHAMLVSHYLYGTSYPRGGPSEIPFHIVREIEAAGGKVLVRSEVTNILTDKAGKVSGVRVRKGTSTPVDISAPVVVSSAGIFNTYQRLLSSDVCDGHSTIDKQLTGVRHSRSCFSLFVGLRGDKEDLQLPAASYWAMPGVNLDQDAAEYLSMTALEASQTVPPILFISFPSAKDPTWEKRNPGKSTALVICPALYEWFSEWEDERVMKRSQEYKDLKQAFLDTIWKRTTELLPQLKDKVEYIDLGTPVTNRYYLGSPEGELYGADHDSKRFSPETFSSLRAKTPVPGLYLAGQDVMTCGFVGAMMGGLLAAGTVLNRNLHLELTMLKSQVSETDGRWKKRA